MGIWDTAYLGWVSGILTFPPTPPVHSLCVHEAGPASQAEAGDSSDRANPSDSPGEAPPCNGAIEFLHSISFLISLFHKPQQIVSYCGLRLVISFRIAPAARSTSGVITSSPLLVVWALKLLDDNVPLCISRSE